jgi:hypothetical protein
MAGTYINVAWTILSKADIYMWETAPYVRRTTPPVFAIGDGGPTYKIDVLIPFGDNLLRAYHIEELIQLVLKSPLRDRLLALDPVNTYEKANLEYPVPGDYVGEVVPEGVRVVSNIARDAFTNLGNGSPIFKCAVDPVGGTVTVDDNLIIAFTAANNLTSEIEIAPGFVIQFQGPLGVTPFTFSINFVTDPRVDWRATLNRARMTPWNWQDIDLRNIAEQDPLWTNQLSAYVMAAIEDNMDA